MNTLIFLSVLVVSFLVFRKLMDKPTRRTMGGTTTTTPPATAHPSSALKTVWGKVEGFWHWVLGIWLPILIVALGYFVAFHRDATDKSVEWVQTGRNWALPIAVVVALFLLFRGKGGHHGGSAHGGHGHQSGLGGGAKAIIWALVLIGLAGWYLAGWHLKVDHRAPTRAEREEHIKRVLNPPTTPLRVTNTVMVGPLTAIARSETVPLQALGASGYSITRSPDSIPILVDTGLGTKLVPAGAVTNFPATRLAFMLAEASDATNDVFVTVEWWK